VDEGSGRIASIDAIEAVNLQNLFLDEWAVLTSRANWPGSRCCMRVINVSARKSTACVMQLAPQRLKFTRGLIARTVRFCTHVTRTR
jgi:hypothetical protein